MKQYEPLELGDRVKDPVTGFTGIVTCIAIWLHGCIRIGVQSEKLKDGKPEESQHFDQVQLVLVKKQVHKSMVLSVAPKPDPITRQSNGGPSREGRGFSR